MLLVRFMVYLEPDYFITKHVEQTKSLKFNYLSLFSNTIMRCREKIPLSFLRELCDFMKYPG